MLKVNLFDVASVERAKKGKIYPAGVILIQLSATRGQLIYVDKSQEIDTRYAVITPNDKVIPYYLYIVIDRALPEFMQKNQTGINLQADALKYLNFEIHDLADQQTIANTVQVHDSAINMTEKQIDEWKNLKKNTLSNMFI